MSEPDFEHQDRTFTRHVQEFTANKHYACPNCKAPGIYTADLRIKAEFPGCYSEVLRDTPVGDVCPNCDAPRPKLKPVRRVKRREWWTIELPRWATRLTSGFERMRQWNSR